jgi:radical SAM superfamily enzyme YgiQ (UPF0313 family)
MYGLPLLATIVRDRGFDVDVLIERLSAIDWERVSRSDVICFTLISSSWPRFVELAKRIHRTWSIPIIIGGTFATYMAERILAELDFVFVVKGEGDGTLPELIEGILEGRDPGEINGIAYVEEGKVVHTPARDPVSSFETIPDYSLVRGYDALLRMSRWSAFRRRLTPVPTLQTSRGCPHHCTFCVVKRMFGPQYRMREIEGVLEDLRLRRRHGNLFFIVDNNFTADPVRTKQLLERVIREDLGLRFLAFSRFDIAEDREMLRLLQRAGVSCLCIGFESLNRETLGTLGKGAERERMEWAAERIHEYGIHILATFIVGADPDTVEACRDVFDFVQRTRIDGFRVFPIFSLPAEHPDSEVSRRIVGDWRYFNGNYVVYFPEHVRPSILQKEILKIHRRSVSGGQIVRQLLQGRIQVGFQNYALRGRTSALERCVSDYMPILEKAEQGRYTADDRFIA